MLPDLAPAVLPVPMSVPLPVPVDGGTPPVFAPPTPLPPVLALVELPELALLLPLEPLELPLPVLLPLEPLELLAEAPTPPAELLLPVLLPLEPLELLDALAPLVDGVGNETEVDDFCSLQPATTNTIQPANMPSTGEA